MGDRAVPLRLDFAQGGTHAGRVDRAVRGDRADHDRNIVLAAAAVGDVGEQQPSLLQLLEVLVKVRVAALGVRDEIRGGGEIHCFSIFALSTTAFHLAVSEMRSSRRLSGELARASTPRYCRRCFTSGAATAARISLFSRSMMAFGVFAGAATPFQAEAS